MGHTSSKAAGPVCVYCNKPLDEVRQDQNEDIVWKWDKKLKQYKKSTDGSAKRPYHSSCDSADWYYIDEGMIVCSDDLQVLESVRRQIGQDRAKRVFVCFVWDILGFFRARTN